MNTNLHEESPEDRPHFSGRENQPGFEACFHSCLFVVQLDRYGQEAECGAVFEYWRM